MIGALHFMRSYYSHSETVVKARVFTYTSGMIDRDFHFGISSTRIRKISVSELLTDIDADSSLIVCDANTESYIAGAGIPYLALEPGEKEKRWDSIDQILMRCVELDLGRDGCLVGFGGGVICDMTGFAASIYLRGCNLVLAPTTLLAMVDASIGGKTGIDYAGFKNLVGTFYPATEVFICLETMHTLPEREYLSGLAEVIKHGLLGAEDVIEYFEASREAVLGRHTEALELSIARSLDIKGAHVEADPREGGIRAHLNLGHTFAHALEAASGFGMCSHGEAVAWGMDRAMRAGVAAGITDSGYADRVRELLSAYGYRLGPLPDGVSIGDVIDSMRKDKKKKAGELRFVIQHRLGETIVTTLEEELVRTLLAED
jgi:3-dehydroquinate synthase